MTTAIQCLLHVQSVRDLCLNLATNSLHNKMSTSRRTWRTLALSIPVGGTADESQFVQHGRVRNLVHTDGLWFVTWRPCVNGIRGKVEHCVAESGFDSNGNRIVWECRCEECMTFWNANWKHVFVQQHGLQNLIECWGDTPYVFPFEFDRPILKALHELDRYLAWDCEVGEFL